MRVKNFFLFTDISEKYELRWTLLRDDTVLQEGIVEANQLHIPCVDADTNQPGSAEIQIPFALPDEALGAGCEYFLNLSLCLREDDGLLAAGFEIAGEQFQIYPDAVDAPWEAQESAPVRLSQEGNLVYAEAQTLRVEFDKTLGTLTRCQGMDGEGRWRDLLTPDQGPQGDFFRASTDNDRAFGAGLNIFIGMWREKGEYRVNRFETAEASDGSVVVTVEGVYPDLNDLALNATYTLYGGGYLAVDVEIFPNYNEQLVYLPVAGMTMEVPEEFEQIQKMGPLSGIMKMIPGINQYANMISDEDSEKQMKRTKAIIQSMTPYERSHPETLRSSMKRRIANGSGTTVNDVNKLLNQFDKMKTMMNAMASLNKKGKMNEEYLNNMMNRASKQAKNQKPKYRLK